MQTLKAARIEQLPVELRVSILKNLADTSGLYNLIRSSREYYQAYIGHEQRTLFAVLCNEMGHEAIIDAFVMMRVSMFPSDFGLETVETFLCDYEYRRKNPHCLPELFEIISLKNLRNIGRTQRFVTDLTEDFYRSTLSHHPISGEELSREPLSRNEKRRINRAFYHYQFFTNLLGYKTRLVSFFDWDRYKDISNMMMAYGISFHCWEVEAITCVREYLMEICDQFFRRCWKEHEKMLKGKPSERGSETFYRKCRTKYLHNPTNAEDR